MNRTLAVLAFSLLPAAPAFAGADAFLKKLAERPGVKNASWGVSVVDARTGLRIAGLNPDLNLAPASALKVFVTAAALDQLGPEKTFATKLYYDGTIKDGLLDGNIWIKGAGDPSLGSQLIKGAPSLDKVLAGWAAAAAAAGIRSVGGAVIGDDSAFQSFQPGSWAWEDIGNYYAAQPSALTVNDGQYRLFFRPGAKAGDPAEVLRTEPDVEGLEFENHVLTGAPGSGDNGWIYAFPGQFRAVLRGTVPQGPAEFAIKGALPDQALFAAQALAAELAKAGIKCGGKAARGAPPSGAKLTLLAETVSPPVKEAVRVTNKRSFNLYAELLLRHLGGGDPEAGLAAIRKMLAAAGADISEVKLFDACGLSPRDLVKPSTFTALLAYVRGKKYFQVFLDSLIYPGDPDAAGHARNLGKGTALDGNLRLKSGSLNGVRAYTGYLTTEKGRTLAFASMLSGYSMNPAEIDKLHEELLLELRRGR